MWPPTASRSMGWAYGVSLPSPRAGGGQQERGAHVAGLRAVVTTDLVEVAVGHLRQGQPERLAQYREQLRTPDGLDHRLERVVAGDGEGGLAEGRRIAGVRGDRGLVRAGGRPKSRASPRRRRPGGPAAAGCPRVVGGRRVHAIKVPLDKVGTGPVETGVGTYCSREPGAGSVRRPARSRFPERVERRVDAVSVKLATSGRWARNCSS